MSKFLPNYLATMKGMKQQHSKDDSRNHRDHQLPVDLAMEILNRLPLKSILKFQVVSKTWRSIIRSKEFINFLVSPSPAPLIVFKNGEITDTNPEKCMFFFTTSQLVQDDQSSTLVANLHMTLTTKDAYFYTPCAPLNGFICLSYNSQFMICNPSTKQVITLPDIPGGIANRYLGYDPFDGQYKAMCKRKDNQQHMVLTLGSGSREHTWRRMEGATNCNYFCFTKGICIDGFVYYGALMTATEHSKDRMIACFDVRSETISFIKPPRHYEGALGEKTNLINYKGKLGVVDFRYDGCSFRLCVLEDVKKHEWSLGRPFRIGWWGSRETPTCHGTTKAGEIIITPRFLPLNMTFYVGYCDVENGKIRCDRVEGVADDKEFRRRHGIGKNGNCYVYISPEHCVNFTFL